MKKSDEERGATAPLLEEAGRLLWLMTMSRPTEPHRRIYLEKAVLSIVDYLRAHATGDVNEPALEDSVVEPGTVRAAFLEAANIADSYYDLAPDADPLWNNACRAIEEAIRAKTRMRRGKRPK